MTIQAPSYEKLKTAWAERRARVIRLAQEGKTQGEIAGLLGVSRSRVNQILARAKGNAPA